MFQKIMIVGNLGSDPEMRYLPDGTAVTNFSVAVNRRWTKADGAPGEETTWFRISAWGKQAETSNQYLARGNQVMIEGRLVPDPESGSPKLFTRRDGNIGASYEIRALSITFLGKREDGNSASSNGNGSNGQHATAGSASPIEEDDIPF